MINEMIDSFIFALYHYKIYTTKPLLTLYIQKIKIRFYEARIQDIDANIKILSQDGIRPKIFSFLVGWYPLRGSVKNHIKYLQILRLKTIENLIELA